MLLDLGGHKCAETRLAERNAQLHLAAKIARIGSYTYDHATQKVQLSPGCAAIYGLPEGTLEISRDYWRGLVDPDDLRRLDAATRRALTNCETELVLEFRILRHSEVRWIETRFLILYNEAGRAFRRIGAQVDVTDRKRAEDTLHQRETELLEAQRLARIGSWQWNAESDVTVGSAELFRIFGCNPATQRVPTYRDQRGRWYPIDDWKRLKAAMQSTLQTGVGYEVKLQAFRNMTPIWITARGAVVRNSADQIVGLRGTVQEITDRKLAELALAERNTQLELASKTARVGSFSVDFSTGAVKLSSRCAAIFGLPDGATEMSRGDGRKLVHPEDLTLLEVRHYHALLAQQREIIAQFRIIRTDDGEVRWIEARNLIFYDQNGEPVQLIGVSIDFTERKVAEEMLAERNLQLEVAEKVGLVGSYAYHALTERIQISPGYAAIYGIPGRTTEIMFSEWLAYVHPGDVEGLQELRNETFLKRRGEYKVDYRIFRRNGEIRWIESRGFIFYGSDARAQRVVGVNIDVTERKRAALALAERNAQLALAADAARVGCYANNLETGLITVSRGYTIIHGLPDGTVQTTLSQWRTRVHPDDLAPFDELRKQIFGSRRHDFRYDYRIIRADGGVRWIESRGCVSYDKDGQPQQCIGINIDVTERKQTEALLSDALAAGRVVAFECDAVTFRSQRSDTAERILGIVQGAGFLKQVHPADRRNFKALIRNLSPGNPSYNLTFRFAHSDGRTVWLEEDAKGEFDRTGKLLRIRGLTRDITDRKELEDNKSALVSELDHRVKNVLATISAITSHTKETSRSRTEFVTALDGRIKSMAIAHELLSSRHWLGVPLAELLHRELAPYADAGNTHIDGPDVVLCAEAGQTLAIVFHELATNATKFGAISAKSGRVSVRWSFSCNERGESWLSMRWEESGGPLVARPTQWGYGTSVVRELVPYELGGTVELAHLPEGVCCNLHIPAQWLSASAR